MRDQTVQHRAKVIRRLARLLTMAQDRRAIPPLSVLAREFGVCQRTVRRDLEALEASAVPVRWRKFERAQ